MSREPSPIDVAVIGGGASGLAAALAAARAGAKVVVVERDVACGLPILATGNGRCNFSNTRLGPHRYRHPDVAEEVMGPGAERRIGDFAASIGLSTVETEGRVYPRTRRAESVRDALIGACERTGVEWSCGAEMTSAVHDDELGAWRLELLEPERPIFPRGVGRTELRRARRMRDGCPLATRELIARTVILAVGGRSKGICDLFGLPHIEEEPLLCPIACSMPGAGQEALPQLDGLRVEGVVALKRKGAAIAYEEGEVLFRPFGISGIAAFNLSRRCKAGDLLELDLFPELNAADLERELRAREGSVGPFTGKAAWFDGLLARPIAQAAISLAHPSPNPLKRMSELLHRLPLEVEGLAERQQAQVRRGGIPVSALSFPEGRVVAEGLRDLHACGEAVDMDADCGGFNLAWAWTSGAAAGSAAAERSLARSTDGKEA
ncbi:MAG: NAD(P)/FAD-dependent oxidoreductase [Collinsella sp.]|nr:NAD(P)/FAD-dependent oxidoreductase [Collinsella sp.]